MKIKNGGKNKRILLIQLRQLGDILLTTPCIRELAHDHRVDFLAHAMGAKVLGGNQNLHEAIYYREEDSFRSKIALQRQLRRNRYDLVFDFMNNPRSALVSFLLGAETWSFESSRSMAYSHCIPKASESIYVVENKFRLLRAAGLAATDIALDLPWGDNDRQAAIELKSLRQRPEAPLVFLSPTHRRPMRKWPRESWIELANWLAQQHRAEVCFVWGPGEQEEVSELSRACSAATLVAPKSTMKELAAMLAEGSLFIGNSNGPSHVAVAAKIPSLQLHGHTDAISWCPGGKMHRAIQSPLWLSDPERAMPAITVGMVQEQIQNWQLF